MFHKKAVLKIFAIFTEKHLYWNLFLYKNAGLQACSFVKKRLQHRCFPVNIDKFLRALILKNICGWLLLRVFLERFHKWTNNIGSEEDVFLKTKQTKRCKTQLYGKNLPFHDVLYHFVFLFFSPLHVRRRLPYTIKDDSSESFKTA